MSLSFEIWVQNLEKIPKNADFCKKRNLFIKWQNGDESIGCVG
jgi:hypothetical protein